MKRPLSKRVRSNLFYVVGLALLVCYALIARALDVGHITYWALGIAFLVIYLVIGTPLALVPPRAKEDR